MFVISDKGGVIYCKGEDTVVQEYLEADNVALSVILLLKIRENHIIPTLVVAAVAGILATGSFTSQLNCILLTKRICSF